MLSKIIFVFLILSSCSCFGEELPSFIKKCYQNDPEVNKCLVEHANQVIPRFAKGVPELGIKPLDPIFFELINTTSNNINLLLINSTLKGLSKTHVSKFTVDQKKDTVLFKVSYFPHMTGKYKLDGKLMLFSVNGEGDFVFRLGRTNCTVNYKHKFNTKDGKVYASVNNQTLKCGFEKGHIHFNNLFGGNKLLGDTINTVLNENYEAIMKQRAQPAVDEINRKLIDALKVFYEKVPYEGIFPKEPPKGE